MDDLVSRVQAQDLEKLLSLFPDVAQVGEGFCGTIDAGLGAESFLQCSA